MQFHSHAISQLCNSIELIKNKSIDDQIILIQSQNQINNFVSARSRLMDKLVDNKKMLYLGAGVVAGLGLYTAYHLLTGQKNKSTKEKHQEPNASMILDDRISIMKSTLTRNLDQILSSGLAGSDSKPNHAEICLKHIFQYARHVSQLLVIEANQARRQKFSHQPKQNSNTELQFAEILTSLKQRHLKEQQLKQELLQLYQKCGITKEDIEANKTKLKSSISGDHAEKIEEVRSQLLRRIEAVTLNQNGWVVDITSICQNWSPSDKKLIPQLLSILIVDAVSLRYPDSDDRAINVNYDQYAHLIEEELKQWKNVMSMIYLELERLLEQPPK